MLRRRGSGWRDGEWAYPGGKVEPNESPVETVIREVGEETALELDPAALSLRSVAWRVESTATWTDFLFEYQLLSNVEAVNREPHRATELAWFARSSMPEPTVPWVELTASASPPPLLLHSPVPSSPGETFMRRWSSTSAQTATSGDGKPVR